MREKNEKTTYTGGYPVLFRVMDQTKDKLAPFGRNALATAISAVADCLIAGGKSCCGLTVGIAMQLTPLQENLQKIVGKEFKITLPPQLTPASIADEDTCKIAAIYIDMLGVLTSDDGKQYLAALASFPAWVRRLSEVPGVLSAQIAKYMAANPKGNEVIMNFITETTPGILSKVELAIKANASGQSIDLVGTKLKLSTVIWLRKQTKLAINRLGEFKYMQKGMHLKQIEQDSDIDRSPCKGDPRPTLLKNTKDNTYHLLEYVSHGAGTTLTALNPDICEHIDFNAQQISCIPDKEKGLSFFYESTGVMFGTKKTPAVDIQGLYDHIFLKRKEKLSREEINGTLSAINLPSHNILWHKELLSQKKGSDKEIAKCDINASKIALKTDVLSRFKDNINVLTRHVRTRHEYIDGVLKFKADNAKERADLNGTIKQLIMDIDSQANSHLSLREIMKETVGLKKSHIHFDYLDGVLKELKAENDNLYTLEQELVLPEINETSIYINTAINITAIIGLIGLTWDMKIPHITPLLVTLLILNHINTLLPNKWESVEKCRATTKVCLPYIKTLLSFVFCLKFCQFLDQFSDKNDRSPLMLFIPAALLMGEGYLLANNAEVLVTEIRKITDKQPRSNHDHTPQLGL